MTSDDALDDSARYVTPYTSSRRDTWTQAVADTGRVGSQQIRQVTEVVAPTAVAAALQLPPGTSVVVRRRVMYLDRRSVELTDSYYPLKVADRTRLADARKIPGGAPNLLKELGYEPHYIDEYISARIATDEERQLLDLTDSGVVIVLFRTSSTSSREPVEVSIMTMVATDRHLRYQLTIGGGNNASANR